MAPHTGAQQTVTRALCWVNLVTWARYGARYHYARGMYYYALMGRITMGLWNYVVCKPYIMNVVNEENQSTMGSHTYM